MIGRWLLAPYQLPFMAHALVELLILGVLAGTVGVFVMLRRLAFIADALTHTIFPGLVVGFLAAGYAGELWGALLAGAVTAAVLTALTRSVKVTEDVALTILLTGMFALGVVLVSRQHGYASNLTAFLFGQVLGVGDSDLMVTAAIGCAILLALATLRRPLLARTFDAAGARAAGHPVALVDLVFNVLVALTVVAAARAVGTLLVIALLLVPAATARLLSDRLTVITAAAIVIAAAASWLGLSISYTASVEHGLNLVSGGTVVLVLVAGYVVAAAVRVAGDRLHAWHGCGVAR